MAAKYRLEVLDESGFTWIRVVSRNGQILLTSEGYDNKSNARRAARKFAAATGFPIVDLTKSE